MVSPIIIVIGILLVLWVVIKFKEMRHRFIGTILLLLILSLFLSATYVINKQDLDLKGTDGMIKFTKYYVVWLGGVFTNAREITGSVINQGWSINNSNVELPKIEGNSSG